MRITLSESNISDLLDTSDKFAVAAACFYVGMGLPTIRAIQVGLAEYSAAEALQLAKDCGYHVGAVKLYDEQGNQLYPPEH